MVNILAELQAMRSARYGGVGFHCSDLIAELFRQQEISPRDQRLNERAVSQILEGTDRQHPMYMTAIAKKFEGAVSEMFHPDMYRHNRSWDLAYRAAMALTADEKVGYIPPTNHKTHAFYLL